MTTSSTPTSTPTAPSACRQPETDVPMLLDAGEEKRWQAAVAPLLYQFGLNPAQPFQVDRDPETGALRITGTEDMLPDPEDHAIAVQDGRRDYAEAGRFKVLEHDGQYWAVSANSKLEKGYRTVSLWRRSDKGDWIRQDRCREGEGSHA